MVKFNLIFYTVLISCVSFCWTEKTRAIVHLGPHKTGTTHLQVILSQGKDYLSNSNYINFDFCSNTHIALTYYLQGVSSIPHLDELKEQLIHENCWIEPDAIEPFFGENLEIGRNVFISSEWLYLLNLNEFEKLVKLLDGFDITFVSTYRLWISSVFSIANQNLKKTSTPCFLSDWFFDYLHRNEWLLVKASKEIYSGVFESILNGFEVVLIDCYGVMHSNVDLVDVILCEVMKLPCKNGQALLNKNDRKLKNKQYNRSSDLTLQQMMHVISDYSLSQGCSFDLTTAIIDPSQHYRWTIDLPIVQRDLSFFSRLSLQFDRNVREMYPLLYANETASNIEARNFIYEEVDREVILRSKEWRSELDRAFQFYRNSGIAKC